MSKKNDNTAQIQQQKGVPGKPFTKADPRINRKGRPKNFDQLRALAQQVASENLGESGLTRIQAMMIAMSTSRNPRDRQIFLEYAFGKVKDEIDVRNLSDDDIIRLLSKGETRSGSEAAKVADTDSGGEAGE